MRIAKSKNISNFTSREDIINNYYVVEDNYDFISNNADDVTNYDTLSIFAGIGRYNNRIYRESLITHLLPVFSTLNNTIKKNLLLSRIYPSGFTNNEIISYIGVEGLNIMNRTISESEMVREEIADNNQKILTYSATTNAKLREIENVVDNFPIIYVNKNKYDSFTGTTINYITGSTNLGNVSIVSSKSEKNLQFKGVSAGKNITVSGNSTNIVISSTPEVFFKEKLTTQTSTSATLVDYDTTTVNLSGGNYKITYNVIWGSSVTNANFNIEFRRGGVNIFPSQLTTRAFVNTSRMPITMVKYVTLPAGSHTFSVAFSTAGGTGSMYYSLILIERQ